MSTVVQSPSVEPQLARTEIRTPVFCLLLGVFIALCFPQVLLGLKTFVFRDFGLFGYPLAYHVRESLRAGEIPLWNPYNNCGLPFLAQWNTMVLYPLSLIYVLLPLPWSLNFFCLFHLFLAGLGMYVLARKWTGSSLGAAVAGTAFAFNGLTLCSLMWPAIIAGLGWMPWVVLTASAASDSVLLHGDSKNTWRRPNRAVAVAALVGAMQMLTGAPEVILFTWFFVAAFIAAALVRSGVRGRIILRFGLIVLLVAGLAAAQLLPFLELLGQSHRTGEFSAARWSMPLWGWANLIVPLFHARQSPSGVYFQADQAWISSYYAGIGALALAVAAALWVRDSRVRILAAFAVISPILALGDAGFVYPAVRKFLPFLSSMRYPVKFAICATFAIPLLAAFGVHWCESHQKRKVLGVVASLIVLMVPIVVFSYLYPLEDERWKDTLWSALTRSVFLILTVGGVWWYGKVQSGSSRRGSLSPNFPAKGFAAALIIIALVWLDGYTHTPPQNPIVDTSVFSPELLKAEPITPQPMLGESRAMLSLDTLDALATNRLTSQGHTFIVMRLWQSEDLNLIERIPKVDGFYPLYLAPERHIHFRMYGSDGLPRRGLGDFLGVSQVTKGIGNKLFAWSYRDSWLPMTTLSANPVFLEPGATLTNLLRADFNPRQVVFLSPELRGKVSATNGTVGRIVSRSVSAHRITVEVETAQPNVLVVAQNDYPCWAASIDGKPVPVHRANYAYQAIEVPRGRHKCELRYEDNRFRVGLGLAIVSGCACLGLYLLPASRARGMG